MFPDAARVTPTDTGWVLETAAGAAVLPDVCGALASAGAAVSAIRVHDIDLADAFRVLTGEAWRPVEKDERA